MEQLPCAAVLKLAGVCHYCLYGCKLKARRNVLYDGIVSDYEAFSSENEVASKWLLEHRHVW